MVATDPVDARLLGVVAEMGKAAVHEVASRVGLDPREVASRLIALSAAGMPLIVGVESDQPRLRAMLNAAAMAQAAQSNPYGTPQPGPAYPPSGPMQAPVGYPPSGPMPQPAQQVPSGPYPVANQPVMQPPMQPPPVRTGPPSSPFPVQQPGPPSHPFPAQPQQQQAMPQADAPISTWGPPQTATWARGDQPPQELTQPTARPESAGPPSRQGKVGSMLQAEGLEGERLSIQLVEVVDPADYLFTAAGYRLQEGERSVVVHTELTNRGTVSFQSLPDLYLVLVTPDGETISKAPVSLSSRPPHRIGVPPGETAGGHTVYVVPEHTEVTSVRWSPRPDEESRTLTWTIED